MAQKNLKGCLVVHGLTGTPANMAPITKALQAEGYLVKAPLLAGHGIDCNTLSATTWQDWYGTIARAHDELCRQAEQIFYVGLSMGSLLGLQLAENSGGSLKGLALLGVPWDLKPIFRYVVIPGIRYTPLRWAIRSTAKNFEKSVLDVEGRQCYQQNSLQRMPAAAVFQMMDLLQSVKKNLFQVSQPLLMIHGVKDHLAKAQGMLEIKKRVSSKQVEIVMMEHSAHVLSLDYDKEKVAEKIIRFFETGASASQTK